ncbi:HipA domain-containing protein [Parabacteroides sp. BX2]|jgi:serine/threonine-protein kinase HipA|uniref:HipA domain-containing protein n=1 Tax=Parabacteroides segnis TaxID=2763058 RepID=A0ABR7EAY2_9BACT|nr:MULTISPECIES: HipA domain-containing protein [Parabacteroides]MBC5646194.1 HipA domain-containing protein [Parabacteroides segnis]MCM0716180.1 HipA domain-containing protein [Parabacteroides sp. TA-V-105]
MERCLYCYQPLEQHETDFHSRCSKKIFGTVIPPVLPYSKADIESLALEVVRSQVTITGVQPKLSVDLKKEKGGEKRFTIVGLWGGYILKPQTEQYANLPENEDLTMHLARLAKINTVPHSLIRFKDGSLAYITKRIDRDKKGNKIPMEDMCQLTEKLTEQKYKGSHEQIAKKIVEFSAYPVLDLINYVEILLFCYLTGNADMHLKNFSLYKKIKETTLTPAYDLLSTKLVIPEDTEELALTLNGKKRKLKRSDFDNLLKTMKVEDKVIENTYNKFRKVLPLWYDFIDISFLPNQMKIDYKALIEHRSSILNKR